MQALIQSLKITITERANPLLVRYLRQQLRNRSFVMIYLTLLLLGCLASIVLAVSADKGSQDAGVNLFSWLAAGLSFAVVVMTGHNAFRAISREREDQTWDLIQLTGLQPKLVIKGIIQASMTQTILYVTALAPFMVLSYLLRGIDVFIISFFLFWMVIASWLSAGIAMLFGCLGYIRLPVQPCRG